MASNLLCALNTLSFSFQAKKKAQAEAKKKAAPKEDNEEAATSPVAASKPAASTSTTNDQPKESAEPADDDAEAEDGEGTTAADKKKKKKKKKGEKAEPAAPAPKKTSAAVQALQARLAAQKKAEEEAEAAHQEALRREEEAERLEKEELEKKEAERARKKEKEKAKKEQLRKEGKLLTPKQKAEKAAAEARMKAMIQSGQIKVEGLEKKEKDEDEGGEKKKRVVYDSKKKKGKGIPAKGPAPPPLSPPTPSSPAIDEEKVDLPTPSATPETTATPAEEEAAEDWDAPSEKEEEEDDDVKDDWDAESEEEEEKKAPTPAPVKVETQEAEKKKKESSKAKEAPKATTSKKPETAPAPKANGRAPATPAPKKEAAAKSSKPAAAAEESSEEESSDDDDDDSDDDSDSDDSDSDDESSEDDDGLTNTQRQAAQRKAEAAQRRKERTEQAMLNRNKDDLRSPICCILGHVDTGKTKLLDKVRQTNVQEGEAGGITQQIGATYFPVENIKQKTQVLTDYKDLEYKIPGLLVIDTPGHESFANLRTRGSSLCNIAILVVDIMHGLEPQTLESIRLLRDKKTPFIVALNKIDRLYGWKATPNGGFKESLAQQNRATQQEFERRVEETIVAFAEQSLNSCLYYENKNLGKNVSLVPTSAHTGEGIPDMLQLLVSLTQNRMSERLMYLSELECTVLEVKVIEGLGTTIDVVLSNGVLNEGDRIVVCGLNGPIVTNVRALLTPQPLKEMRVKGSYVHHKQIKAAMGVKITAPDLEKAIAGSRLLVCGPDDDEEELMDEVMSDLKGLLNSIERSDRGVAVQASTLGSLEALLEFLKQSKIPVSTVNIGPVFKKDVVRIMPMLEKAKEMACMLCFDVAVDKDAEALADANGIKVFKADIIYHLFDAFTAYRAQMLEAKKKDAAPTAVWPCRLSTIAAFAKRDPIILGCDIIDGSLRVGTPLCVVKVDEATKKKVSLISTNENSLRALQKPDSHSLFSSLSPQSIVYLGKVTSLE